MINLLTIIILSLFLFLEQLQMRTKIDMFQDYCKECPQQKLKKISYTQEVIKLRQYPITPQRIKKQVWVMDAWEATIDQICKTPQKNNILQKHSENLSANRANLKQKYCTDSRYEENNQYSTPQTMKQNASSIEKENKYRFRVFSQNRSKKNERMEEIEDLQSFKKPISSFVYPVLKDDHKQKNRRIDRFHSFVARSIRK